MTKEVKLCKDCVHCKVSFFGNHWCKANTGVSKQVNLVTGEVERKVKVGYSCEFSRNVEVLCGKEAYRFKQDENPSIM